MSSLLKLDLKDLFSYSFMAVGHDAWVTVAFVLAILAAFGGYFFFVKPERKYANKIVTWLRNFLNGKELLIEPILKVAYIFVTIYGILVSFSFIGDSFMMFLMFLIGSIVIARVAYELLIAFIGIYNNTKKIK